MVSERFGPGIDLDAIKVRARAARCGRTIGNASEGLSAHRRALVRSYPQPNPKPFASRFVPVFRMLAYGAMWREGGQVGGHKTVPPAGLS